jgi:hypothetical protein
VNPNKLKGNTIGLLVNPVRIAHPITVLAKIIKNGEVKGAIHFKPASFKSVWFIIESCQVILVI